MNFSTKNYADSLLKSNDFPDTTPAEHSSLPAENFDKTKEFCEISIIIRQVNIKLLFTNIYFIHFHAPCDVMELSSIIPHFAICGQ